MAVDLVGDSVLVAIGIGFEVLGGWMMKAYWPLWREGVETRATIVRAFSPYLGNARFQDSSGQDHSIEGCAPPRFGKFVEGDTRPLTYLPWRPARWQWGHRKDQRFNALGGLYFAGIGVVELGVVLKSILAQFS